MVDDVDAVNYNGFCLIFYQVPFTLSTMSICPLEAVSAAVRGGRGGGRVGV